MKTERFTPEQIEALRANFGGLDTFNPDRLPEVHRLFDGCPDQAVSQLAKAGIKFLSRLAVNECCRRGLPR